jgi:hypothetical protein
MLQDIQSYLQRVREENERLINKDGGSKIGLPSGDDSASFSPQILEDHDSEDGRFPKSKLGEELRARHQALQSRLRECQVLRHKIVFLMGDLYNVLGNSDEERTAYEEADELRKQLLQGKEERRAFSTIVWLINSFSH